MQLRKTGNEKYTRRYTKKLSKPLASCESKQDSSTVQPIA